MKSVDNKWICLSVNLCNDIKYKMMKREENGKIACLIWIELMTAAGQMLNGGVFLFAKGKPYTPIELSVLLDEDEEDIKAALKLFEKYGLITYNDDGVFYITNWFKYQEQLKKIEKIKEGNRVRQARYQAKQNKKAKGEDVDLSTIDDEIDIDDDVMKTLVVLSQEQETDLKFKLGDKYSYYINKLAEKIVSGAKIESQYQEILNMVAEGV